jgi:hypothetical protein
LPSLDGFTNLESPELLLFRDGSQAPALVQPLAVKVSPMGKFSFFF